jgi:hypothetical protein
VEVDVGYQDFSYGSVVLDTPTAEKPESKLWWNDGFWWGSMWNDVAGRYEIHKLDLGTHQWSTTGVPIDDRPNTAGDALWDGQSLYVVSHEFDKEASPADSASAARLYRYDYQELTDTYTPGAGFPVLVNMSTSETLVLTKDSTGQLWVTWVQDGDVMINRSTTDDRTWGAPFVLPVQVDRARSDDISSLIAFQGDRIGLMWSDQSDDRIFFAVHRDDQADLAWQAQETALEHPQNESIADDHVNLATCDATGRVFAVTKTGLPNPEDPELVFLKRETNGSWTNAVVATDADDHTRPMLVVSSETNTAWVFASSTLTGNQEVIFMKVANLDDPVFPPGKGTSFIQSEDDEDLNNPTSTKQCLDGATGVLVLTSDKDSHNYLHNSIDLSPTASPVIYSFYPAVALAGTEIRIMGAGFAGATSVSFGGTPASFTEFSAVEIRATVPLGATTGKISIMTPRGPVTTSYDFIVPVPPSIASFSPETAPAGASVQIDGTGFMGVTEVTFGGVLAGAFTVTADSAIAVTVPSGAVNGPIEVTNLAGNAASDTDFTVIVPPAILTFVPAIGEAGTVVALLGSGFTGATSVAFTGAEALVFTVVSDTTITTVVPTGATTGPVSVTNAAGTAVSGSDFIYVQTVSANDLSAPFGYGLDQNLPNPFRPHTEIRYQLPRATHVRITVYNVQGRRVRELVDEPRPSGRHAVRWDGRDESGSRVASGSYVYELRAGGFVARRTMTLLR